jgi:predicted phage tail component-like protein
MAGRTITYGGVDLTRFGTVEGVDRDALGTVRVQTADVPGMDGTRFLGATIAPLAISARIRVVAADKAAMRGVVRQLAGALRSDGPQALTISDEPSVEWMAVTQSCKVTDELLGTCLVAVTWTCPDPAARSTAESTAAGGEACQVGGTYQTRPTITVTGAAGDSDGLLTVTDDGGRVLTVALGSTTGATVVLDCGSRLATVDGAIAPISLDSDWWAWEPGAHSAAVTAGSGTASVSWHDRWC